MIIRNLFSKSLTACVIGLFALAPAAPGASYKATEKLAAKEITAMISDLSIDKNDTICAVQKNGEVILLDNTGKISKFNTGMSNTTTATFGDNDSIYVFSTRTQEREFVNQGRKYKQQVPVGVSCSVFSMDGKKERSFDLKDVKSAKTAKFINNKLLIADMANGQIMVCNPQSGKVEKKIGTQLRLCCGIFHFNLGPNANSIIVSNLGAFKLEVYSLSGHKTKSFGNRGRTVNDFHGCCNPVSAAMLPNGSILTVEKDPTRIKVYDKNGKKAEVVSGVEELVKGCSYIPVAVDSKGNIFLSARTHIVKCEEQK